MCLAYGHLISAPRNRKPSAAGSLPSCCVTAVNIPSKFDLPSTAKNVQSKNEKTSTVKNLPSCCDTAVKILSKFDSPSTAKKVTVKKGKIVYRQKLPSCCVTVPSKSVKNIVTEHLPGKYITRLYWHIKYKYSVRQYQVYDMLVRGRTWYLCVLVYLVGYRPTAVCAVFFVFLGGLIRQGSCHGVACEMRMVWCIWVVLLESQVR